MKVEFSHKHTVIRLLVALLFWLLLVAAAVTFLYWVHSTGNPLIAAVRVSKSDLNVWEIFFSVFGLIYAIVIGLFIVEAHRRARDLATAVQSELSAIADIVDFLKYLENGPGRTSRVNKVKRALRVYAQKEVIEDLNPQRTKTGPAGMAGSNFGLETLAAKGDVKADEIKRRRQEVSAIIDAVKSLLPQRKLSCSREKSLTDEAAIVDDDDRYALDAIIKKIGEMTTFRAQKTEVARRGFPPAFYILMAFMSIVNVVGIGLLPVESKELHYLLIVLISSATSFLFLLVWDLDRPLTGYWNIRDELQGDVHAILLRLDPYDSGERR